MRKLLYPGIAFMLIASFVAACGSGDDDDDNGTTTGTTGSATVTTQGTTGAAGATASPAGTTAATVAGSPTGQSSTGTGTAKSTTTTTSGSGTAESTGTTKSTTTSGATATMGTAKGTATAKSTGTTSSGTTTSGTMTADDERLMDLLLTEDEAVAILGDGWSEASRDVPPVVSEGADNLCGADPFPGTDQKVADVEATWISEATFGVAAENATEFPEDVVDDAMDYLRSTVDCTEWTDSSGAVSTVSPWGNPALADLGDDAVGAVVTTTSNGLTVDMHVAFVQTGNVITEVLYGDPTVIDSSTAEQTTLDLLNAAIDKVEAGQ